MDETKNDIGSASRHKQWINILLLSCGLFLQTTLSYDSGTEYCEWDTFNASCPEEHVIMMESALYGRMRLSRCINNDYGHLRCSADVLPYAHSKCSGRQYCQIALPDPYLDKVPSRCPDDLEAYLEVTFTCVKVQAGGVNRCRPSVPIEASPSFGYIGNYVTSQTGKGSTKCPWLIQASEGQFITITLLDFGAFIGGEMGYRRNTPELTGLCHIYGYISEKDIPTQITVCGGDDPERVVYTSESNSVKIVMASKKGDRPSAYFLLKYHVSGCPNILPSSGSIVQREGQYLIIRCRNDDSKMWRLQCEGGSWVGHYGNCTSPDSASHSTWNITGLFGNALDLPAGFLIAMIAGIAVIIACIILVAGICCLKRRRSSAGHMHAGDMTLVSTDEYPRFGPYSFKEQYPMLAKSKEMTTSREREYTTTLQRNLSMPPPPGNVVGEQSPPCPMHRHLNDTEDIIERKQRTISEHIYESPTFARKSRYDSTPDLPVYHELEASDSPSGFDNSSLEMTSLPEHQDPYHI